MTTLCPVCKESVGSAHKCTYCSKNMHVFCGRGIGNEGYGQKIICPDCDSKATGAVAAGAATTTISPTSENCDPTRVIVAPATPVVEITVPPPGVRPQPPTPSSALPSHLTGPSP